MLTAEELVQKVAFLKCCMNELKPYSEESHFYDMIECALPWVRVLRAYVFKFGEMTPEDCVLAMREANKKFPEAISRGQENAKKILDEHKIKEHLEKKREMFASFENCKPASNQSATDENQSHLKTYYF